MHREWCKLESEVGKITDSDKPVMTLKVPDLALVFQKAIRKLNNVKMELDPYRRVEISLEEKSWE